MSDFNGRMETEKFYVDSVIITDNLDSFLQEIDIIFSTEKGSVVGNRGFGQNLEHLLWTTSFTHDYIEGQLSEDIKKYCNSHKYFIFKIKVSLMKGSSKDIGVIDIHISDKSKTLLVSSQFLFK